MSGQRGVVSPSRVPRGLVERLIQAQDELTLMLWRTHVEA